MIEVTIPVMDVNQALSMVNDLRSQGIVQGVDFDFSYNPPPLDEFSSVTFERSATFKFHTEKYATLFTLKYLK